MVTLKEFMDETKPTNRWLLFRIGIISAFAGSILTFIFLLMGFIK